MIARRPWAASAAVTLAWLAACGGPQTVRSTPPSSGSDKPSVSSRWSYHPDGPRQLLARMDLGEATRLYSGRGGERWLVHAREGTAEAAPLLADEDLVAITRPDAKTFAFLGTGGTIYVAQSALGPFTEVRRMDPAPMRVAAAGKSIVALHWDGTVQRSLDAGKTFAPVTLAGARPFDVALSTDGRAMILGFPERLWISRDDAATWSPSATPTVGAGFVGLDANGALVARGIRSSVFWPGGEGEKPSLAERGLEIPPLDLLTDLEQGPSASALANGRAVLTGFDYFEVARREDEGPWYLAHGRLTERINWLPIPQSDECKHMAIGAHGRRIVLGCMSAARKGGVLFPSLRVIVSRDGGSTFTPKRPTVLVADEEGVALTVLSDDTLVISGACKPDMRGVCTPDAPMVLKPASETTTLQFESTEPAKLPRVIGRVGRVLVGEGGRLYAQGQLAGQRPALLISDDRGESFRAVPVDLSNTAVAEEHKVQELLSHMQPGKLVVTEDKLSWVLETEKGPVWVVLDRSGRVVSAHLVPEGYPLLEAVGTRGIAYGGEDGAIMESADGGASFQPLTRLPSWMATAEEGPVVWCDVGGCVFGGVFSRLGWGSKDGGIVVREKPKADSKADSKPELATSRTPIVCETIESAQGFVEGAFDVPNAADAQRGSVAWSAVVANWKTGAVQSAQATATPKHAVRLAALFGPSPRPGTVALDVRSQAEGAAALRYAFAAGPDGQPTVGSPVRRVEVAWDNQFEGPVQRAVLTAADTLRAGDVSPRGKDGVARANVSMLSVAPGGIHVCVHKECNQAGDRITFLRQRGPSDTVPIPPWPTRGLGGGALALSHHVMHVKDKQVPLAIHQHFGLFLRADRSEDGDYTFHALGLAPWKSEELGIQEVTYWSYLAPATMGLSHLMFHPSRKFVQANVYRFDTDEGVAKAVPAPTQDDLSDPPLACSAEQKASSFRVPSPALRDTRHPVVIDHGRTKELMHTQLAVLYGSPSAACADVLDAQPKSGDAHRRALIPVGAMDKSWLVVRESSGLRWYGMRCRFEPNATFEGISATPPPPPAAVRAAGGKRPATEADCEAIFDRIVALMGAAMPPGALGPARDAFKTTCTGKPVDMECVRNATDFNVLTNQCLSL